MSGFRTITSSHGIKGLHIILIGILLFTLYSAPSSADAAASAPMYNCLGEVGKLNTCAFNCWIQNNGETACEYWVNTCKARCSQSSPSTKTPTPVITSTSALSVSVQTNANSYILGDPYTLSVSVDDSSTNSPVSGASLTITYHNQETGQRMQESGTTNSAGKYSRTGEWSESAVGTITITVTATKASFTSRSASTTIAVSSGQTAPDILQASFSANPVSGNSPLKVQFSDRSTGNPNKWRWEFGDGAISTSQNPVHTYNAIKDVLGSPDYFTVTLTIWNAQSSDVATKVNYITVYQGSDTIQNSGSTGSPVTPIIPIEPAQASFTSFPSSGPAPLRVSFSDTSTGTVISHLWDFGDGYKSELTNPSHTFKEAGTYTVRLTVGGAGGTDTARKTISVTSQTDDSAKNGGEEGEEESSEGEGDNNSVDPTPDDSLTPEDIGAGAAAGIAGVVGGIGASLGVGGALGWGGIPPPSSPPPGSPPPHTRRPRPKRKTWLPKEDRYIEIFPGEYAHVNDRTGKITLEDGSIISKDDLRDKWRAEHDGDLKDQATRYTNKQTKLNMFNTAFNIVQFGCDTSMSILGKVTGPAGATIDTAYNVTKTFASELSKGSSVEDATVSAGVEYVKGKVVGAITEKIPRFKKDLLNVDEALNKIGALEKIAPNSSTQIQNVIKSTILSTNEAIGTAVVEAGGRTLVENVVSKGVDLITDRGPELIEYQIRQVDPGYGSYYG